MEFCRPGIPRPSMGRHGTPTRNGVGYLVACAFRSVEIPRPEYFLKYFRTYGGNLLRCVISQRAIKKWNIC